MRVEKKNGQFDLQSTYSSVSRVIGPQKTTFMLRGCTRGADNTSATTHSSMDDVLFVFTNSNKEKFLKHVIAHEVGHCVSMVHNHKIDCIMQEETLRLPASSIVDAFCGQCGNCTDKLKVRN